MQPDTAKVMLAAAFYADSYALPFHWQSGEQIAEQRIPSGKGLHAPHSDSCHGNKRAGDLTHVGDQTLLMYQLLQREARFSIEVARTQWCQYMQHYGGYMDAASAMSLQTFRSSPHALKGSDCDSMAGAARIAPFVYFIDDLAALLIAVEAQTRLTHSHPTVVAGALFLTKLAYRVKRGQGLMSSIDAEASSLPSNSPLAPLIDRAQQRSALSPAAAIQSLGADSLAASAFTSTMLLLFRFEGDYWSAITENVRAGGDSATRGALCGLILGASLTSLPAEFTELRCYSRIMQGAPQIRAH